MKNQQVLRRRNIGGFVFFFLINCNPSVTTSFFQYKFIFLQQAFLIFYCFHVASYELDENQRKTSFFVFLRIGTCILLTKTVNIGGFVFFFLNWANLMKTWLFLILPRRNLACWLRASCSCRCVGFFWWHYNLLLRDAAYCCTQLHMHENAEIWPAQGNKDPLSVAKVFLMINNHEGTDS